MKKLEISKDIHLPMDTVTQTLAVVARKRVGKTYTASVMAEELILNEQPIVVLDPTGAWWGLRSSANGKKEGFPVVIIGGAHADVPLEETAGDVIADLVVDHPGYYVIDFSQIESDAAVQRFATAFAKRFYFRKEQKRFPIHLFIDEADVFIPQNPFKDEKHMLHAFDVIVRRGGIRGIGVTMITQRPAVLNKNVLTQCETLIALQISGSQDVDAIEHWIRLHGTKEQKQEFLSTVSILQKGEAWVWSPSWLECFKRVQIRERVTFNSSATPKAGEVAIVPTKLAPVDIEKLGEKIKATIEHQKENEPGELKRKVADLQRKLTLEQQKKPEVQQKTVSTLTDADRALLKKVLKISDDCRKWLNLKVDEVAKIQCLLERIEGETLYGGIATRAPFVYKTPAVPAPRPAIPQRPEGVPVALVGVKQKILDALGEMHMLGVERPAREIIAFLSGYTNLASKGFVNAISELRVADLVSYPDADSIMLTGKGYGITNPPQVPRSSEEIQDRVFKLLGGKSEEILRVLIKTYPVPVLRTEVAAAVGYGNLASKGFVNTVSRLRTLGFVDYPSTTTMKAPDILFLK